MIYEIFGYKQVDFISNPAVQRDTLTLFAYYKKNPNSGWYNQGGFYEYVYQYSGGYWGGMYSDFDIE